MTDIYQVDTAELIKRAASKLKSAGVKKPEYIDYVKTGAGKERVTQTEDFWYIRCASVLRKVYINGPVGIARLRTVYGTRKRHTTTRHHHYRAGGSILKDSFDALEKLGYLKKAKEGRVITSTGRSFLDKVATEIAKGA